MSGNLLGLIFRPGWLAGLAMFLPAAPVMASTVADGMTIVGAVETVRVYPGGIEFRARIDTGAATTSINAHAIENFMREGRRWVRFEVIGKRGQAIALERPVLRTALIKQFDRESKRRVVVHIGICLGGFYKDAEVSLQDRSRREFPVLIGRRYMAGAIVVDPAREYLAPPNCPDRR